MEVDQCYNYVDQVLSHDSGDELGAVKKMKNVVIGNNKQKTQMIEFGVLPRLLHFMIDDSKSLELRLNAAIVLGSLAKGSEENIQSLLDSGCISVLLKDITHSHLPYVEACLRCLRTMFNSNVMPTNMIYQDHTIVPHMINILSKSICTQECISSILANCCKTTEHQTILCSHGAVTALAPLLLSDVYKVQLPALRCFAMLCLQNPDVSNVVAQATHNGENIPLIIVKLLRRDKPTEMQMNAAKCMTYMYRANAIESSDHNISHKTLPTLIRMCSDNCTWEERVEGAETLAYLTEVDIDLQMLAASSDQIIELLSDYFRYPGSPLVTSLMPTKKDDITVGNELRQAAFRVYASLGANDEEIRKKIIGTQRMMEHIVNGLSDPVTKVLLAAVRCMHSLSRSVQQLRTSFHDHNVWKPLMKILENSSEEVLVVASSTLCNLLLDFSPSKEPMVEMGAIELLVGLTRRDNPKLRLNGIWALMNLAFQTEQKIKSDILGALSTDELFRLLTDNDEQILMKTLGLLRNLLSNKPHIDHIMMLHGHRVMQAVILILEGDHKVSVKEQALCILANVADGKTAKTFVMENDDILKKIINYMTHTSVQLQIAATFCITNLVWDEEEGSADRQEKLRELGVQKILQDLIGSEDHILYEKVKTALQQF